MSDFQEGGVIMGKYEYAVTKHAAEDLKPLVYFCSERGECKLDDVSTDTTGMLEELLNEQGKEGWEAVHLAFGKGGMIAVWKRAMT